MDRIRAAELQADAIAIEMLLHMVYVPRLVPDAVISEEAADAARDSLLEIRRDVEAVAAPAVCHAVRGAFLDALEAAARLYAGIQGKDRAAVRRDLGQAQDAVRRFRALAAALAPVPGLTSFRESQPRFEDYVRNLRAWRDAPYALPDELIEQFDRLAEQGVADDDPALIAIMDQMTPPVRVLPWEDKRFDVPAIFDRPEIRKWDDFYPLLWILLGGDYHPFMYDAFVAWRSSMQAEFFGFSNFSSIPNAEYNEVRLMKRGGYVAHEWQVIPGRQNHYLDCRVYARAAAMRAGLDRLAARTRARPVAAIPPSPEAIALLAGAAALEAAGEAPRSRSVEPSPKPIGAVPRRAGWLGRDTRNWLGRR